uniref:Uncharacterized protein n=1 Tax=Sus scrofa TaxID=9823 RepID=A0A4X1W8N4_PIG
MSVCLVSHWLTYGSHCRGRTPLCQLDDHTCAGTHTLTHTHSLLAQRPATPAEPLGKGELFSLPPAPHQAVTSVVRRPYWCCQLPPLLVPVGPIKGPCPSLQSIPAPACPCQGHGPSSCNCDGPDLSHLLKEKSKNVAVASYFN